MHRTSSPLYELGIWDLSRHMHADGAGRYMRDTNALARLPRLPNLCIKDTARYKCSLNRLTVLVHGHDWMGQAPAHAFQSTSALPKACGEVIRGPSHADMGTHLRPAAVEQRKVGGFPCRRARAQPEGESKGRLPKPPHVPRNDGVPVSRQTREADADTHSTNRRETEPAAPQDLLGNKKETNMWAGCTRSSRKCVPSGALKPADLDRSAEVAQNALKPPSTRRKRMRKAYLHLLSRESRA